MFAVRLAALVVVGTLAVAMAGFARPDGARAVEPEERGGITVTGTAKVASVPDRAEVTFGVESRGRTAREALAANSIEMRRVLTALRRAGVAPADLQTQNVSLSPVTSDDGRSIAVYAASNSVTAVVGSIGRVGAVIDAGVEAGANTIYGPSLGRSDTEAVYRQALRAAVLDARAKAETLADAGGVVLGDVTGIVEAGAAPQPMPLLADRSAGAENSVPIEPGTMKTQASVTVTFAVQ